MAQPFAGCNRTRFSRASRARRMEASSSIFASLGFCGRCSSRSICLRLRSMNDRHSGAVIVSKFSERRSTLAADMMTSCEDGFRMSGLASPIMPNWIASAKQIATDLESRRGQGCDICAAILWRAGHSKGWCAWTIFATTSRDFDCAVFDLWLCKGDMSIRIVSSTGWGFFPAATATY